MNNRTVHANNENIVGADPNVAGCDGTSLRGVRSEIEGGWNADVLDDELATHRGGSTTVFVREVLSLCKMSRAARSERGANKLLEAHDVCILPYTSIDEHSDVNVVVGNSLKNPAKFIISKRVDVLKNDLKVGRGGDGVFRVDVEEMVCEYFVDVLTLSSVIFMRVVSVDVGMGVGCGMSGVWRGLRGV